MNRNYVALPGLQIARVFAHFAFMFGFDIKLLVTHCVMGTLSGEKSFELEIIPL